jgi:hypothetical protein
VNTISSESREYCPPKIGAAFLIFLVIFGVCFVLIPIIVGLWRSLYAYTNFGPSAILGWSLNWALISLAGIAFLLSLILFRIYHSLPNLKLGKHGIRIKQFLRPVTYIKWREITGISETMIQYNFLGRNLHDKTIIKLYLNKRKVIKLTKKVSHLSELVIRIKSIIYPRITKTNRDKYRDHLSIFFGAITIQKESITISRRVFFKQQETITFDLIRSFDIANGTLKIIYSPENQTQTRIISVPTSKILNLEPMMRLLNDEVAT